MVMKISLQLLAVATLTATLFPFIALAQDSNKVVIAASTVSNTFRAKHMDVTPERISRLKVPAGFKVSVFAEGTGHPRMMEVLPDGTVYVTDRNNGTLIMLKDQNKDGKADVNKVIWQMEHLHGIDYYKGKLYLVTVKEIYTVEVNKDGTLGKFKVLISDLPDAGQHHNRTLKFGPDSLLYVSIGSTCNMCNETTKESAAMIRMRSDGSNKEIFCKGLRNTIGFDWHPRTKQLWGWDNGMDDLGDTIGKEEFNMLVDSGDYGWPFIFEKGMFAMRHSPRDKTHEEYDAKTIHPILLYDAHAASMEFMFYAGAQFPNEYRNDGFVAMRGSWNRTVPSGHNVLRVKFDDAGNAIGIEEFLTGFLVENNTGRFGRPIGIAQYIDGSLLISDDLNGIIYRVSYDKEPARKKNRR
jgi:glucose/arabinose dehydrogenase